MATTRRWYFDKRPKKDIEADTLALREEALPALKEGEFLLRAIYLSMDATNRLWLGDWDLYMPPVPLGQQQTQVNPPRDAQAIWDVVYQLLSVFFALALVALVIYLLWEPGGNALLRRNMLVYGLGGVLLPFAAI